MSPRYIPAIIIVIALIGATVFSYHIESSFIAGKEITSGKVVALGGKSTSSTTTNGNSSTKNTQALVDFDANGSTYRAEGRAMGFPRWEIGQSVDVYYSPQNPREARIKRWDELYFFTVISSFFLSFCLLMGSINIIAYKVRGKPFS